MKALNTILVLLMVNFAWGQIVCNNNDDTDRTYAKVQSIRPPIDDRGDNIDWAREDFIKNEISVRLCYSYCFDKNLNNIEDSFLLYREQFDIRENKILKGLYERKGAENIIEIYYNAIGQIIKEKHIYNNPIYYHYYIDSYEVYYEYDSLHREEKKTEKEITKYSYKRDTVKVIYTKIDEHVYNSNNQKRERYSVEKREATKYFITKRKPKTNCDYYLSCFHTKWEYDTLSNLTEEIFSENDEIQYKYNYFYDNQNRVIKQIDSTNWDSMFYCDRTITYEYTDTSKIVTEISNKIYNGTVYFYDFYYYNNGDKIVKHCYGDTFKEKCTECFYLYENDKLIKKTINYYFGSSYVTAYFYNEKGLLKEEQTFENDKMTKFIRYYYK